MTEVGRSNNPAPQQLQKGHKAPFLLCLSCQNASIPMMDRFAVAFAFCFSTLRPPFSHADVLPSARSMAVGQDTREQ